MDINCRYKLIDLTLAQQTLFTNILEMGFEDGAPKWITRRKPKGFFQKRKTPLSEKDGFRAGFNYQDLVKDDKVHFERPDRDQSHTTRQFPTVVVLIILLSLVTATYILYSLF